MILEENTINASTSNPSSDLIIALGGILLLAVMSGFIVTTDAGFSSMLSAILIVPAYFSGEGAYNLAVRRWPHLSAETGGFCIWRVLKGALIGTLFLFAGIAVYFALV